MVDIVDRANDLAQHYLDNALQNRIRVVGESKQDCIDCGAGIELARRQAIAGCERCVGCQEIFEVKQNQYL